MAAAPENVLEDINEKLLTCKICEQLYDLDERKPRILPCHHTLCGVCIARLKEQHTSTCPFCRKFIKMSETFPEDTTRVDLLEYKKTLQQRVTSPRSRQDTCQKHQGKELEFLCTTCKIALCSECAVIEHGNQIGHKIVKLKDFLEQVRDNIEICTLELEFILKDSLWPQANMAATSLQETDTSFKAAEQEMEDVFSTAAKILFDRKAQAMEELRSKWKDDRLGLEEQAAVKESIVCSAEASTELGRTVASVGLPGHMAALEQELERAVQEAKAEAGKPVLSSVLYKVNTDLLGLMRSLQQLGTMQSERSQSSESKTPVQQAKQTETVTSWCTGVSSTPTVTSLAILTPEFQLEPSRCKPGCTLKTDGKTLYNKPRPQSGVTGKSGTRPFAFLGTCGSVDLAQPALHFWSVRFDVRGKGSGDRCEFGLASLQTLVTCEKEQRISDHDVNSATLVLVGGRVRLEGRNWTKDVDTPQALQQSGVTYTCLWEGHNRDSIWEPSQDLKMTLGFLYDNRQPQGPRVLVVETESCRLLGVRRLSPSPDLRPVLRVWPTRFGNIGDVRLEVKTGSRVLNDVTATRLQRLLGHTQR